MSNRQFLPLDHDLRQCVGFANGEKEERTTPTPCTLEEEHAFRRQYEEKPNNSQRAKQQKKDWSERRVRIAATSITQ